ncbi:hypothetical protein [Streptomyces sp. NBC_01363]|uniref:TRADD-N-associated membrane domain-containing protein n=1 Tax=Streptomyces sp. NBC_01363 TaxID=2903840 RepID=UPI00225A4FB2|nr:hypothetical protein [Streptomyces sp. NBC_01363]MCX4735356.1 hypothetical protein [Streptomyces sp. NBC_01363]
MTQDDATREDATPDKGRMDLESIVQAATEVAKVAEERGTPINHYIAAGNMAINLGRIEGDQHASDQDASGGAASAAAVGVGVAAAARPETLAEQRQKFHFEFLNHSLKQAEWTFRLSVWFMTGGALVVLTGAVLALVYAGNPDVSFLPYVTALTGALITVGGGALALHSKRTMANLTKQAEHNDSKIDIDHKLEMAMGFIDRVDDPERKDRLNSAAAMKALDMQATPKEMVNRLLPEDQPKQIEPGGTTR